MSAPRLFVPLGLLALWSLTSAAAAAQYQPPASTPPDAETLKAADARTEQLEQALDRLRRQGVHDPFLADVEIYLKAARWIVAHNEFYHKDAGAWTLAALDRGLLRASQAARGESPWLTQPGQASVRAYRSVLDGSVQPYAVTYPADYGKGPARKWRVDLVLHGRNPALTEVSFLHSFGGDKPAPKDQDWVQIDLYGRGNNAYRWAGEADVYEAFDHFVAVEKLLGRGALLDPNRVVLRGFSMGGAGTWQLGLHRPDRWCLIAPGAGFTTTHGYIDKLPNPLPPYQEACLSIYDALPYAENAFDVPIVAYSGAEDKQKAAADNIEAALKAAGLADRMVHLVAPGLAHSFPAEWQKKAQAEYARFVARGRPEYPPQVRFVTCTLKYSSCQWVDLLGLEHHYRRALVDARRTEAGFEVKTDNVRVLSLRLPPGSVAEPQTVTIDGDKLAGKPYNDGGPLVLYLERRGGKWSLVLPERLATDRLRRPQKTTGMQGPIDDAFTTAFVCVRGTGKPWHEATAAYAKANLERFEKEWAQFFRGKLPVKDDVDVTPGDLATSHLILFGDPASNSLLAQALPGLPLQWTAEKLTWQGKDYPAAETVPVLVYPSPFNADRYVVLNSGHTFHAEDLLGTNALLYPRLGDYAVLKLTDPGKDPLAVEVLKAGLFDEFWRF